MERKWNRDETLIMGIKIAVWGECFFIIGSHSDRNPTAGSWNSHWKKRLWPLDGVKDHHSHAKLFFHHINFYFFNALKLWKRQRRNLTKQSDMKAEKVKHQAEKIRRWTEEDNVCFSRKTQIIYLDKRW